MKKRASSILEAYGSRFTYIKIQVVKERSNSFWVNKKVVGESPQGALKILLRMGIPVFKRIPKAMSERAPFNHTLKADSLRAKGLL